MTNAGNDRLNKLLAKLLGWTDVGRRDMYESLSGYPRGASQLMPLQDLVDNQDSSSRMLNELLKSKGWNTKRGIAEAYLATKEAE